MNNAISQRGILIFYEDHQLKVDDGIVTKVAKL